MLLPPTPTDVIDGIENALVDITVVLGCRLTADVGGGGYDGFLETVAEFLGEWLVRNADTETSVLCDKILSQVDSTVEDKRRRFRLTVFQTVDKLPGHVGHMPEVALHTRI